ncbi:uncharacterized protein METZ01_LOCUS356878, partial [marine metagenome]
MSIGLTSAGQIQVAGKYASVLKSATTDTPIDTDDRWYHIAVTHDPNGGLSHIDFYVNNVRTQEDKVGVNIDASPANGADDIFFGHSSYHDDFEGTIDDARLLMGYEKRAFAGGLMISKVDSDTNVVTIYNSNTATISTDGIVLYTGSGIDTQCGSSWSDTSLSTGETATNNECTLD